MSITSQYPHLSVDADGTARLEGIRYKVIHLAGEHYHHGWPAEELLRQHPDLRPEQVYAALTYFYDHFESMIRALGDMEMAAQREAERQPLSRAEMLGRRAVRGS